MQSSSFRNITTTLSQKIWLMLFGLLICAFSIEIALRIAGYAISSVEEHRNSLAIRQGGVYRIMCLGESTTAGEYPHFLEEELNRSGIGVKFSVINKGIPGGSTSTIVSLLQDNIRKYKPDMVVAMIGVNDTGPHMPYKEVGTEKRFTHFMRSLRIYKLISHIMLRFKIKFGGMGVPRSIFGQDLSAHAQDSPYQDLGNHQDAVLDGGSDGLDYLKKAFENNPSDCRSCLALGEFYANRNMFIEEEKCLTKYINMCPYNPKAYSLLVSAYRQKRRFADAERLLTGLLDSGIHSSSAYYELGLTYLDQGKYKDAEKVFKSIIKNDPNSPQVYADLFNTYAYQGKTDEAESFFLSLYAKDKNNIFLLNVLGWLYRSNRDFAKAERYLSESLKLNPHNGGTIFELAKLFIEEKKYSDAERLLKKGIIQGPDFLGYYIELGRVYFIQNKTLQAKELMRLALERFPGNDLVGGLLSVISLKDEAPADYKNYVEMVINMRLKYYNSVTKTNYLKLKRTLDENKIQLVAVQYPMRSILPLKKMLEGENGIIFVDNENLFKNAVKKEGYNEFFLDCFGGDFGHCTKKGNRLLANNIANTIKKELVRK